MESEIKTPAWNKVKTYTLLLFSKINQPTHLIEPALLFKCIEQEFRICRYLVLIKVFKQLYKTIIAIVLPKWTVCNSKLPVQPSSRGKKPKKTSICSIATSSIQLVPKEFFEVFRRKGIFLILFQSQAPKVLLGHLGKLKTPGPHHPRIKRVKSTFSDSLPIFLIQKCRFIKTSL